ncbi:MAG: hypothetical protein ACT4P0_09795 [Panacagrimonas sp.]
MKRLLHALVLASLVGCASVPGHIPAPAMATAISMDQDPRTWVVANGTRGPGGYLMELVPQGQNIKSWSEMASNQIVFTDLGAADFVANWKAGIMATDPKAAYQESTASDGSITVHYESALAREKGIRRFIKGPDGIYMVAYHARPESFDPAPYQTWGKIIAETELTPDSHKR